MFGKDFSNKKPAKADGSVRSEELNDCICICQSRQDFLPVRREGLNEKPRLKARLSFATI